MSNAVKSREREQRAARGLIKTENQMEQNTPGVAIIFFFVIDVDSFGQSIGIRPRRMQMIWHSARGPVDELVRAARRGGGAFNYRDHKR